MSYMEKLLEGVEVEWTVLGNEDYIDIANTGRRPIRASLRTPGKTPYYGANNIQDYVEGHTHNGVYVLIAEDGTRSIENYSIQYAVGKFWANNHVHVIRGKTKMNSRFLFHYLQTVNFIPFLSGGARAKLTRGKLVEIPIPLPPLEIQQKIVYILDTFTELTAELTARQKQYDYYREQLLSFEEGLVVSGQQLVDSKSEKKVEWKILGEVGEFIRGSGLQKKDFRKTGVGCIHYGQIHTHYGTYSDETITFVSEEFAQKARKANTGDLIIATTSEDDKDVCKSVAWLGEEQIAVSSDACIFRHSLNSKYVAYFFQTHEFDKQKQPFITGAKVRRVNPRNLAKIKIPVPPLEEQERIVSILDKFDTLTHSISEGLPREIELRQKQYEYYRGKLLSFATTDTATTDGHG